MATNKDNNPSVSGSKAKNAAASKSLGSKTPSLSSTLKKNAAKTAAKTSTAPKPKPDYFAGVNLSGAVSALNNASKTPKPAWATQLEQNIANPRNSFANFLAPKPSAVNIVNPRNNMTNRSGDAGLSAALKNIGSQQKGTGTRTGGTGGQAKSIYDYLNVDPTQIYKPLVDLVQQQRDAANERYQANLGDIKNIFSALTSVAPADRLRINEQFKNMLTAQQTALAARTAAATEQGQAGAAQAVATGAERGGGEAMALNPLQTATAEGIADSNAIASVWEGLQGANQAQALADVENRGAGYTAQQLAATQGLQQSLGDRLMGIAGTEADIQSQLAQQKFDIAQSIGQQKYQNALAAQQAAASAAAASPAKLPAIDAIRARIGSQRFNALNNQLQTAASRAFADLNAGRVSGTPVKVTGSDVLSAWRAAGGNPDLLNEATTLAKTIYNK